MKLFNVVIWKFLLKGIGQSVTSGLAVLGHGIWGVMILLWALLSNGTRVIYDTLIYHLVVKHLAKVPSKDEFLVKRIKGPGLSEQYHYVINYDLVMIMLQFELEKMEFDAYYKNKTHEIEQPYNELLKYYNQYDTCGMTPDHSTDPLKKFSKTKSDMYGHLNEISSEHWKNHKISNSLNERDKIRINKADLFKIYDEGSQLCNEFVTKKIFSRLTQDEILSFWRGKDIAPGDWKNLVIHCLRRSFSSSITTPIEDVDNNGFTIDVKKINAKDFITKLFHANLGDTFDVLPVDYTKNCVHDIEKFDTNYLNLDTMFNNSEFMKKISINNYDIKKYEKSHAPLDNTEISEATETSENATETSENTVKTIVKENDLITDESDMIDRQSDKQEQLQVKLIDYKTFNTKSY